MSDVSQGPGWWQASDGKWYPPKDATQAPAPGWWMASDGKWYPPLETEKAPAPGWWMAADGKWYPPEKKPATPASGTNAGAGAAATAPSSPKAAAAAAAKSANPTGGAGGKTGPAKPAGAKAGGLTAADAVSTAQASADDLLSRPIGYALSPEEQIRVRNEQSRRDAQTLAGARRLAATRALGSLQDLIEQEKASQGRELRESPALRANADAAPTTAPTTTPAPAPATPAAAAPPVAPKVAPTAVAPVAPVAPKPAVAPTPAAPAAKATPAAPAAAPRPAGPAPTEAPLLEVKQGTLAADLDRLGERLVIFNDRVELHDRNDRVRQVIAGPDITDVVVHKKFTGSTVTVESSAGESIVAKGLKPDQADEIRALILKGPRQLAPAAPTSPAAPVAPTPAPAPAPVAPAPAPAPVATAPAPAPAPAPLPTTPAAVAPKPAPPKPAPPKPAPPKVAEPAEIHLQEADLLAKLTDLHKAGVLTDDEFEEKKALISRLARGGSLAATSSTPA